MSVKKVKGGYKAFHCHGKDKGKPMSKKPKTKTGASAQHRAAMANKKK